MTTSTKVLTCIRHPSGYLHRAPANKGCGGVTLKVGILTTHGDIPTASWIFGYEDQVLGVIRTVFTVYYLQCIYSVLRSFGAFAIFDKLVS